MIRKEIPLLLAAALVMNSCRPIEARAQAPDPQPQNPVGEFFDPDLSATPYPVLTDVPTLIPPVIESPTPVPTEILDPRADICVLPFPDATMHGLQFKSTITNNGLPVTEADGTLHRHLGLDFEGGREGIDIVNMCDGEIVFAGAVKKGTGLNLGNIVVMKYTYEEDGVPKNVFMRYAHMENITNLPPGTRIPRGQKIGEMGHSGGWPQENVHLHIDLWREKGWNRIVVDRSNGDLKNQAGYYAEAEIWGDNTFDLNLMDPRKWLQERLQK
jgi:murein DD-endopeptidase MepM/ murein hydrolase activator NlpD